MLKYYISKWRKLGKRAYNNRSSHVKYLKEKAQIVGIIGSKCQICGSIWNLRYHEIYGKPHECELSYILQHSTDFVCLCQKHHALLHFYNQVKKLSLIQKRKLFRFASFIQ